MHTITHAIASTTSVRTAVPSVGSTPEMPTFPRIDVRAANSADASANVSQLPPPRSARGRPDRSEGSTIRSVPAVIATIPPALHKLTGSPSRTSARMIARTVDSLSIGATRDTSPRDNAAK